jgi:glycosyltransferase involved in cell wall biosynthesis
LSTTLGVLLPVYNAQSDLAARVADLLEVLGEWAFRFELVIFDDGSTDDTAEIALDLAARYPQVRVLGNRIRLGLSAAIQSGLANADCRIILIGNDAYQLEPDDLRAVWRLRDIERQSARRGDSGWPTQAAAASGAGAGKLPFARLCQQLGFQLCWRAAFEQFRLAHAINATARIDAPARGSGSGASSPAKYSGVEKRTALG